MKLHNVLKMLKHQYFFSMKKNLNLLKLEHVTYYRGDTPISSNFSSTGKYIRLRGRAQVIPGFRFVFTIKAQEQRSFLSMNISQINMLYLYFCLRRHFRVIILCGAWRYRLHWECLRLKHCNKIQLYNLINNRSSRG